MAEERKGASRTSVGQLRWIGKKLLQVFIIVASLWLLTHSWSVLTDHRPIKVEQYYPDENALQQALYKMHPVGSPVEYFMADMEQSKFWFRGDPVKEEDYHLKGQNSRQAFFYLKLWDDFSTFSLIGTRITVEYDVEEKITGIFVHFRKSKWDFAI